MEPYLVTRRKDISPASEYIGPDHITAVQPFSGQGPYHLAELRNAYRQWLVRNIPQDIDLAEHRMDLAWKHRCSDFGDRLRIVSSGSSDIRLADTIFIDNGKGSVYGHFLSGKLPRHKGVDPDQRHDVRTHPVKQTGVRVIRDTAKHRENQRSFLAEQAFFVNHPSKDAGNLFPTHLDVVGIWQDDPFGIQLYRTVRSDCPARLRICRIGTRYQCQNGPQNPFHHVFILLFPHL